MMNIQHKESYNRSNVDKKIEGLKTMLDKKIEETLEAKKTKLKEVLKVELNESIDTLRQELHATKLDLEHTKTELSCICTVVEPPYNPNQSVVIYGLKSIKEEQVQDTVCWLFSSVLEVEANIINVERIEPRGVNQIGLIHVELANVTEKINVLRAKRRCLNVADTKDVIIRTCDSHDSRVNELNSRKLL